MIDTTKVGIIVFRKHKSLSLVGRLSLMLILPASELALEMVCVLVGSQRETSHSFQTVGP